MLSYLISFLNVFDRHIHTTDMFLFLGGIHSQNQGIYVYQGMSRYIKLYRYIKVYKYIKVYRLGLKLWNLSWFFWWISIIKNDSILSMTYIYLKIEIQGQEMAMLIGSTKINRLVFWVVWSWHVTITCHTYNGHTEAKFLIICSPNLNPSQKHFIGYKGLMFCRNNGWLMKTRDSQYSNGCW